MKNKSIALEEAVKKEQKKLSGGKKETNSTLC